MRFDSPASFGHAVPVPEELPILRSFLPGKPLERPVLAKMESLFGTPFGDVRIHESPDAAAIGASAFTLGSSIYFAFGQYNPTIPQGERLLAQHLAYVVQQRSGRVKNQTGSKLVIVIDPLLKAEAEMMAARALASKVEVHKHHQFGRTTTAAPGLGVIMPGKPRGSALALPLGNPSTTNNALLRSTGLPTVPHRMNTGLLGQLTTKLDSAVAAGKAIFRKTFLPAGVASEPIMPPRPTFRPPTTTSNT
jgi:hypothetical protein